MYGVPANCVSSVNHQLVSAADRQPQGPAANMAPVYMCASLGPHVGMCSCEAAIASVPSADAVLRAKQLQDAALQQVGWEYGAVLSA